MTAALVRVGEVASTQEVAKALAAEGAPGFTIVVAERQTAGRGRLGRSWIATEGSLALSMIVRVPLPPLRAPRLTLCGCAGVLAALDDVGVAAARVKWPNDIVVARAAGDAPHPRFGGFRKVGGLLVEAVELSRDALSCAVLGLGLNVAAAHDFPDDVASSAGTLAEHAGFSGTRDDVLEALRVRLPEHLRRAADDAAFGATLATLRARSATLGRRITIDDDGRPVAGRAIDLEDDGALVVESDDGVRHTVRAGDVWLS